MSSVFNDQDEGWEDLEGCNCESCRQGVIDLMNFDEELEDEEYLEEHLEDNFFDGDIEHGE